MSCSRVRRELLEHFAFHEELGPQSWPHLAHLESCADCRQEVGIDRELVRQLRRALRERVEGTAPSEASWHLVRRRTVDRPVQPWTARVRQWGGILSAAAAAVMMFAVATAPQARILPGAQSPVLMAASVRRAVPPLEEARAWPPADSSTHGSPQTVPPFPGWPMDTQLADPASARTADPPITGHMR